MDEDKPKATRKPWLAGLLSGLQPGLGQLYNGEVKKAVLLALLASVLMAYVYAGLMIYGPFSLLHNLLLVMLLALTTYVLIIRDAMRVARSLGDSYELKPFNKWYVYVLIALVAGVVGEFIGEPIKDQVQAFKIPAGSMMPTLLIGDHILVDKSIYRNGRAPQRGDIIVFKFPEDETKDFVKRVIGLPGDTVQIRNKLVYVNGTPLDDHAYSQRMDPGMIEAHINPRDNFGPSTVPNDSYFVLGDNRDQSLDSRFWGAVEASKIKGKATVVYWSWNGQGTPGQWIRWRRIGQVIQ